MRLTGIVCGIATTLCAFWGQIAPNTPLMTLRIVDSDGRPVPQARVCVRATLQGEDVLYTLTLPAWQRVSPRGLCVIDGQLEHRLQAEAITRGERTLKITVMVQASGYRPTKVVYEGKLPREATITLQPARMLKLRLTDSENRPMELKPRQRSLIPDVYDSPILIVHEQNTPLCEVRDLQGNPAKIEWFESPVMFLEFGIERLAEGVYRAALPESVDGTLYIIINAPGTIQGYLRPISPDELQAGLVEVRLPKPSRVALTVDFQTPEAREATQASITLTPANAPNNRRFRNSWSSFYWTDEGTPTVSPRQPRLVMNDLAPGAWEVSTWLTKDEWDSVGTIHTRFDAPEDGSVELTLRAEPFDLKQYQGNRTLTVKVQRAGGKPLANAPYRLELYVWQRGKRATIAQGKLDANGAARLSNLYELPKDAEDAVNYILYVNDERLTYFNLRAGDGQRELVFTVPPRPGDPAPNITVVDLNTGKPIALQSLRGKWVYLEFWATWCGPCQTAMQALKQATDQHGARWRGKLEILTVSVDDTREVVTPHLKQRGWDKFARHAWDASRQAANLYGVQGIPTAFLINPAGKVVWTGHPLGEDPGEKINRYLQGGRKR